MAQGQTVQSKSSATRQSSFWRDGWPGGLGSILMISIGLLLKRWLPFHFAAGIGGFVAWFIAGLIYARRSPPRFGLPVWAAALLTALVSGLCLGVLYYYIPLDKAY